jgi:hypothetical protein
MLVLFVKGGYDKFVELTDICISFTVSLLSFLFLIGVRRAVVSDASDVRGRIAALNRFDLSSNHWVIALKRLLTLCLIAVSLSEIAHEMIMGGTAFSLAALDMYLTLTVCILLAATSALITAIMQFVFVGRHVRTQYRPRRAAFIVVTLFYGIELICGVIAIVLGFLALGIAEDNFGATAPLPAVAINGFISDLTSYLHVASLYVTPASDAGQSAPLTDPLLETATRTESPAAKLTHDDLTTEGDKS